MSNHLAELDNMNVLELRNVLIDIQRKLRQHNQSELAAGQRIIIGGQYADHYEDLIGQYAYIVSKERYGNETTLRVFLEKDRQKRIKLCRFIHPMDAIKIG